MTPFDLRKMIDLVSDVLHPVADEIAASQLSNNTKNEVKAALDAVKSKVVTDMTSIHASLPSIDQIISDARIVINVAQAIPILPPPVRLAFGAASILVNALAALHSMIASQQDTPAIN